MSGREFKNLIQVHEHLEGQGWKISRSSLYNHAAKNWLTPGDDGVYTQEAVDEYAKQRLRQRDGSSARPDKLAQEKRQAEIRYKIAQAARAELTVEREAGGYVPRAEFELALAARARLFRNDLKTFAASEAPEIVSVAGGDRERIPELIEFLQDQFDLLLDRYSRDEEFLA